MHATQLGDIDSWLYLGADYDRVARRGIVRTGSALATVQLSDDGSGLKGREQELAKLSVSHYDLPLSLTEFDRNDARK